MPRLPTVLLLASLTLAGGAPAADVKGSVRLTGRTLVDSNAPREFTDDETEGPRTDLGFSLLGSLEGEVTGERLQLVGRYELGGRAYMSYTRETALVQAAAVEGSIALGTQVGLGLEGHAKDRRGGSRDYSDLGASVFAEYAPDVRLALRIRAGAHRFVYRPYPQASFGAPEVGLRLRYRFDRRHTLSVFSEYGSRRYAMEAQPRPQSEDTGLGRRKDGTLAAGVGYTYRGPVALGLTYTFQESSSNSFGETVLSHRLSGTAGIRLPWRLTLLAHGTLGLNRYPDGIAVSPDTVPLVEEGEGQNSLSLKLIRPVSEHLDVELSYSFDSTRLPRNDFSYLRQVGGVGLTWHL